MMTMMAPAFSSPRQAGAFALLLTVVLALPWLGARWGLPPRQAVYSSMSWLQGDYPYMARQIFEERGDIDVAFLGSSHLWAGIDAPYVQQQLGEALGRPATVVVFGWAYSGLDGVYTVARDLLAHRKVRLLVIYDDVGPNWPHQHSWRWARFGESDSGIGGLPARTQLSYYYGAIVGMPRNLLNRLRPNGAMLGQRDQPPYPGASFPPETGGALLARRSFDGQGAFQDFVPRNSTTPADVLVHQPANQDAFRFQARPVPPFQTHFAQLLRALVREKKFALVCLNIPVLGDHGATAIPNSRLWLDWLREDAALAGVVPTRFFDNLSAEQARLLFQNDTHLNVNGAKYYTRLITPAILQFHAQANP